MLTDILAVVLGYLLGAIPSAYLIGRLNKMDLAATGNGELGASLAFRRLGIASGSVVVLMDLGKSIASIAAAQAMDVPRTTVLLAGFAAVLGHDWSIFLAFKGGRGSVASYGVMSALWFWPFLTAFGIAVAFVYFVRKSTLATVLLFIILTIILNIQGRLAIPGAPLWQQVLLVMYPMTMLLPGFFKIKQVNDEKEAQQADGHPAPRKV